MKKSSLIFSLIMIFSASAKTIGNSYRALRELTPIEVNKVENAAKVATYHGFNIAQKDINNECQKDLKCQKALTIKIVERSFMWLKKQELKDIYKAKSKIKKEMNKIDMEKVLSKEEIFIKWDNI